MKKYLLSFLFSLLAFSSLLHAQKQKPQWEMPFYFEDADGVKDTIWIGHDPVAKPSFGYDSLFENYQWIDTSRFNVAIFYGQPSPFSGNYVEDSANKIIVNSDSVGMEAQLDFIKGKLPLKITWPDSLLNSDSLPFPDISPRHRAKVWIPNGFGIAEPDPAIPCCTHCYYVITQDTGYLQDNWECPVPGDSMVLSTPDNNYYTAETGIEDITLIIVPQNKPTEVGIKEKDPSLVLVFPNPAGDFITIKKEKPVLMQLTLFNTFYK